MAAEGASNFDSVPGSAHRKNPLEGVFPQDRIGSKPFLYKRAIEELTINVISPAGVEVQDTPTVVGGSNEAKKPLPRSIFVPSPSRSRINLASSLRPSYSSSRVRSDFSWGNVAKNTAVGLSALALIYGGAKVTADAWVQDIIGASYTEFGAPIETKNDILVTDPESPSLPYIPIYRDLSRDPKEIEGWVKPGEAVQVFGREGPPYEDYQGLGHKYQNGKAGLWYFTPTEVPAYKLIGPKKHKYLAPIFEKDGSQKMISGYIQGSDLRLPGKKDSEKVQELRESLSSSLESQ